MGQEMCCAAQQGKQFIIKGRQKTVFKPAIDSKQQKYLQSQRPKITSPYVQNKKKILDPYKIKINIQRGKIYKPFLVANSGVVYQGQWLNGQPHGIGQLFFNNGSYYYGTFDQGFVHGQGRFISSAKVYYEGQIRHNVAEGKGICVNDAMGYQYNGEWLNDLPNGIGKQFWKDGTKYQGDFTNGAKNGRGTLTFGIDRSVYNGFFKENQFQGEGELSLPQGIYRGNFKNGMMEGKGIFIFKNGDVYDGEYKNNRKHGAGKYYQGKKVFEGKWEYGIRYGEGFLTNQQGETIKGNWIKGQGYNF